jgi:glycosyltransferase involved in cell wall biosynthesis
MKITFVLPQVGWAGGIRVVAIYADRLKKRGHEVVVVSTPPEKPSLRQQVKSVLKGRGWIPYQKNLPSFFDSIDVPHKVLERFRPVTDADIPDADVVVATWWETAEWVAALSKAKGAKAYFIQHYEAFDYLPTERVSATWSLPMHKITVAQWLVDLALTRYGDRNVSLVPCSVDTKQFYAPKRSKQLSPTVGMVYSALSWKGSDLALKAFSLAQNKIPNLRLVVFGGESPSPALPLPPGTEYVVQPPQNELKDFYSRCDAWLFSSRSEGFGLPIIEAMACRTPVIGTPLGAAPELLNDGAGILVKPEDPVDMATAIERIVGLSETEWQAMSDAAYAKATGYTWDNATELFEAALYTAIEHSNRRNICLEDAPKVINQRLSVSDHPTL